MAEDDDARSDDDLRLELKTAGADLAGALVGGGLGIVGGPPGILVGAALGVAVQHTTRALVGRFSRRQEQRVGAALLIMEDDAQRREQRGEHPRDDGFFDDRGALRPEAEELLEGILRQAAESHEERKVPLIARLYSGVAYDATVSENEALYLVRVAGELTYRQFVALAVIAHLDEHEHDLAQVEAVHQTGRNVADEGIRLELSNLVDLRLVGIGSDGYVGPLNDVFAGLLPRDRTTYAQLALLPAGERLVSLTGAREIAASERAQWIDDLTGPERP